MQVRIGEEWYKNEQKVTNGKCEIVFKSKYKMMVLTGLHDFYSS